MRSLGRRLSRAPDIGASINRVALAGFPGAVLIVRRDGTVEEAKPGSLDLLGESWAELQALAGRALAQNAASVERVASGLRDRGIEVTLLPLCDSEGVLLLANPPRFTDALQKSLIESRQRFKDLVEAVSDFCWETDREGRFSFISPKGALGWTAEQMVGCPVLTFLAGQRTALPEVFRVQSVSREVDVWFRNADGDSECFSVTALPLFDSDGTWTGSRGLCRVVTERRHRALQAAEQQLRAHLTSHITRTLEAEAEPERGLGVALASVGLALSATGAAVLRRHGEGWSEVASWGAEPPPALTTAARHEFTDQSLLDLVLDGDHLLACSTQFQGACNGFLMVWRAGETGGFGEEDRALPSLAAEPFGAALVRLLRHEEERTRSRTDPLTGALNRRGLMEAAGRRIARHEHDAGQSALIYVDVDNFKLVNDTYGHAAGDEALVALSAILRSQTRESDLLARLGGDEFAVWLDGVDTAIAAERAQRIIAEVRRLADRTGDPARPLGVSLGIALSEVGENLDALMERADGAMYEAKRRGKGNFAIATPTAGDRA